MTTALNERTDDQTATIEPALSDDEQYARRYRYARERVRATRSFLTHFVVYLVVNAFLFTLNMVTDSHSLWFYWPLLGWGVAVAIQALFTFGPISTLGPEWEERKIKEYLEKDQI